MKKSFVLIAMLSALHGAPALATTFIASYVAPLSLPNAPGRVPSSAPALPPGLYVQVVDGAIVMANSGGSSNFTAGQFGYTASSTQSPVVLPRNPGVPFTAPPSFSPPVPGAGGTAATKAAAVDCVVR